MRPPDSPGGYLLWLPCRSPAHCVIGKLGSLTLQPGFYLYVGSALGPGGLAARLRHHLNGTGKPHWHIDHLRQRLPIRRIWLACGEDRREHRWALALARQPGIAAPLKGFGSSDCRCPAHLFHMRNPPPLTWGKRILNEGNLLEIQAAWTGIE